jgi:hypothetical protein
MDTTHEKDLINRPLLQGGAKGEQAAFLNIEDYKTIKERERINAQKDKQGQMKLF